MTALIITYQNFGHRAVLAEPKIELGSTANFEINTEGLAGTRCKLGLAMEPLTTCELKVVLKPAAQTNYIASVGMFPAWPVKVIGEGSR